MNDQFDTPILFIIFNRLDTTQRVFAEIKKIAPRRLFVSADGARADKPEEAKKVAVVRDWVINNIDWPCVVEKKFEPRNLGCKIGVSSAIDWFFSQVEEGIILEDDCLPDQSLFEYCKILLEKYRHDTRVMHIGGVNFQNGHKRGEGSYYFSIFSHIWGWATWRRAWANYDVAIKSFPNFLQHKQIDNIFQSASSKRFWLNKFKLVYENKLDTWDYQWVYSIWRQGGLAIIPNFNLVSNIGFGPGATHTKTANIVAEKKIEKMESICHPQFVITNSVADNYYSKSLCLFYRLINKLKAYAGLK